MGTVATPHFAVPFRQTGGRFSVVEQDSDEDVVSCTAICLATPQGSRAEVPDYGVPRLEFNLPLPTDVVAAVEEWEPRVSLDIDVVIGLSGEETVAHLTALVANAATGEDDTT